MSNCTSRYVSFNDHSSQRKNGSLAFGWKVARRSTYISASVCWTQFNTLAELPRDVHGSTIHEARAAGSRDQNGRGGVLRQLGVPVRHRPLSNRVLAHVALPRATTPATASSPSPAAAAAARAAPAAAPPSSGLLRDRDGPNSDHGGSLAGKSSARLGGVRCPHGVRSTAEHHSQCHPRSTDRHLPYR